MKRDLRLVGHYNPHHQYPSLVVPICQDATGQTVAVYTKGKRRTLQPVVEGSNYIRHDLADTPEVFDSRHRLLAYSLEHVTVFDVREEVQVISKFLDSSEGKSANPFLLLPLAAKARRHEVLARTTIQCFIELDVRPTEFVDLWYQRQLQRYPVLRSELPPSAAELRSRLSVLRISTPALVLEPLRRAARLFNSLAPPREQTLVAITSVGDRSSATEHRTDGAVIDANPFVENAFASQELVLAVRPELAKRLELGSTDWKKLFDYARTAEPFSWIRPNSNTMLGRLLDFGLVRLLEEATELQQVEQRVRRYQELSEDTVNAIVREGTWLTDAVAAPQHIIDVLAQRLAPEQRPIVLSHPIVHLPVHFNLETFGRRFASTIASFGQFLRESFSQNLMRAAGLPLQRPVFSPAQISAASRSVVQYRKPVAVCLILDLSDSMKGRKLSHAKIGLSTFLGKLMGDRGDAVGLTTFANTVTAVVPMAPKRAAADLIQQAVAEAECSGQTALLDAAIGAVRQLNPWSGYIRIAVLLTDGRENASTSSIDAVLEYLSDQGRTGTIVVGLAYGEDADNELLSRICRVTGGYSVTGNVNNIESLFDEIATGL